MEVHEALERIRNISPLERAPESVSVTQAVGRILHQKIEAAGDSPTRDNSAMDGFVFRKADLDDGRRCFPIAGDIRPEHETHPPVAPQTCARIVTGAPIPDGGDVVVPVELTEPVDGGEAADERTVTDEVTGAAGQGGRIDGGEATDAGNWIRVMDLPAKNPIRRRGEGFRKGDIMLKPGTVIRAYEMGLMIESGQTECSVRAPLRVAIQVTGSEVTPRNNSNGPVLQAIMNTWPGTAAAQHPVIEDDPEQIRQRLLDLKPISDIIITTGSISAGAYDYLYDVLTGLGARPVIRKINQKPGKPFTLFRWDDVLVCCLPGNPVSAVFTAELYGRAIVRRLLGLPPMEPVKVVLDGSVANPGNKTLFLPVRVKHRDGRLLAETGSDTRMRSHLLQLFRDCNGYLQVPPETRYEADSLVDCYPFSRSDVI